MVHPTSLRGLQCMTAACAREGHPDASGCPAQQGPALPAGSHQQDSHCERTTAAVVLPRLATGPAPAKRLEQGRGKTPSASPARASIKHGGALSSTQRQHGMGTRRSSPGAAAQARLPARLSRRRACRNEAVQAGLAGAGVLERGQRAGVGRHGRVAARDQLRADRRAALLGPDVLRGRANR